MWYQNIWTKKIGLFLVLAVLYTLLPATIRQLVGSFRGGKQDLAWPSCLVPGREPDRWLQPAETGHPPDVLERGRL